ncbi:DUF1987 domain-containing protein [Fundidesulfovibrio butyratiphilus]
MQPLDIPASSASPAIRFQADPPTLLIRGESYPENSFEFYAPVLSWLGDALGQVPSFTADINVSYMNSSSTKCMLDLLDLLEEAAGRGVNVRAVWRYDPENPRSLDLAEEFQEEVTFPFDIVTEAG